MEPLEKTDVDLSSLPSMSMVSLRTPTMSRSITLRGRFSGPMPDLIHAFELTRSEPKTV